MDIAARTDGLEATRQTPPTELSGVRVIILTLRRDEYVSRRSGGASGSVKKSEDTALVVAACCYGR